MTPRLGKSSWGRGGSWGGAAWPRAEHGGDPLAIEGSDLQTALGAHSAWASCKHGLQPWEALGAQRGVASGVALAHHPRTLEKSTLHPGRSCRAPSCPSGLVRAQGTERAGRVRREVLVTPSAEAGLGRCDVSPTPAEGSVNSGS